MKVTVFIALIGVLSASAAGADDSPDFVPGFTEPLYDVEISFSEPGRISAIAVTEGEEVEAGTLLISLDKKFQELEVKRQEFKLTPDSELAYMEKRKTILHQQLQSAKSLLDDGSVISREEFEEKELQFSQATSELARLKLRRKIEELELELSKERLERRLLKAPVGGKIAKLYKGIGEHVVPHDPLLRIINTSTGRFVGNAEESLGHTFKVGDAACMRVHTPSGIVHLPAAVNFLSSTVDTASGLMEIKALFANHNETIRLGSPAELLPWQDPSPCPAPEEPVLHEEPQSEPVEESVLTIQAIQKKHLP